MKRIKLKTMLFSLLLFLTMWPAKLSAQNDGSRGLFGLGPASSDMEYNNRGGLLDATGGYNIGTQLFGSDENGGFNIGTQQFGQEAPLGGGWLVLTFAGVAYAFKKRKNNNA